MGRINELWAYVAEDTGPDDEGVVTAPARLPGPFHQHVPMPLMGGDPERMASMRVAAQEIADGIGKPVKLLMFSVRHEVETLVPHGRERNGH